MIYKSIPKIFNPKFEVVSCYLEANGEILLLHRQDNKSAGNTWGVPAGKINEGETPEVAMIRELLEETGFKAESNQLNYLQKVFVKYPEYDFVYHMFVLPLEVKTEVKTNPKEHKDFVWVTPKKALKMSLVPDLALCIKLYYKD